MYDQEIRIYTATEKVLNTEEGSPQLNEINK